MIVIYLITCLPTGQRYVGKTSKPLGVRWGAHCSLGKVGGSAPISRAIRRYGADAFVCERICAARTEQKAGDLERRYIGEFQTLAPLGFNITTGGKNGYSICRVGRDSMRPKKPWRGKRRNIAAALGYDVRLVKSK